jgi:hypothetical protein
MKHIRLSLPWKFLIFPSRLKDFFAGYFTLVQRYSLSKLELYCDIFPFFRVCAERSGVIFMFLPLYVSWH